MENASKALLMGGGMLIAILTLSLVVFAFNSIAQNYKTQDEVEVVKQVTAFNSEYESYNRKLLRGTDVISLCNKAMDNNERNYGIADKQINIQFQMAEAFVYKKDVNNKGVKTNKTFNLGIRYNMSEITNIKNDSEAFTDFKRRIFNCQEVIYNTDTGRIKSMFFKEQKIDYTEGL